MELRHRCHRSLVLQMMTLFLLASSPFSSARPDDPMAWPFAGYAGLHSAAFTDSQSTILPAAFQTDADIHQLPKVPQEVESPANSPSAGLLQQGSDLNSGPAPNTRLFGLSGPTLDRNTVFSETDFHVNGQFDFNHFPQDFNSGAVILNGPLAVKIGGYVKGDLIHDFDAIDSTDIFDPATIPINAPSRSDSRFHARQTRLNLDARWAPVGESAVRVLVEGDFFGDNNTFRLRHAYGERDHWLIGQTWSTFAHRAALPNTLDLVGDVGSIGRRQAQLRWTLPIDDQLEFAAALEDTTVQVEPQFLVFGVPRSPSPDFVARLRYKSDVAQLQLAGIVRRLGFQPDGMTVRTFTGSGLNATAVLDLSENDRAYGGILWGTGIGSYRDLPDLAPTSLTSGKPLASVAWYLGLKHQWTPGWSSNFTFSDSRVESTAFQSVDSLSETKYLAANLIWQPQKHGFIGIEYLWGYRQNRDTSDAEANRLMMSVGFILP